MKALIFIFIAACAPTTEQSVVSEPLCTDVTAGANLTIDDGGVISVIPNVATNTLTATEARGTVNVTPAAIYTAGTVGIGEGGATTPGTFLDVRHNWVSGWDDFELVEDGPNTSNGVEIDYVRGYGNLDTHTSTTTGTEISHVAIWGYDTNNHIRQIARERWMVNQADTSSAVQGAFDLWMANSSGVIKDAFRFDSLHHLSIMDVAAPVLTACGLSPSIVGSDAAGTVVVGSAATGCTITFNNSYQITSGAVPVHCTVTSEAGLSFLYATTQTAITVTNIGDTSSTKLDYTCIAAGVQ